ncbi:hypothetical protein BST61_g7805 [Cercospora zeina]
MAVRLAVWTVVAVVLGFARAHTVITYPGWRGNNLHTTGELPQNNPDTVGVDYNNSTGEYDFPYGMQWIYPCGGMPMTQNRTKWPKDGGALSVQPGWFSGHQKAFFYVNIGITPQGSAAPPNYSHPVVHAFQIGGPNNSIYGGQFCLPQVRMPPNLTLEVGDNITIQVIETAQHGAALYSCVDVTLVDNNDPSLEEVTAQNCYNSSYITFQSVFTSQSLTAGASALAGPSTVLGLTAMVITAMYTIF